VDSNHAATDFQPAPQHVRRVVAVPMDSLVSPSIFMPLFAHFTGFSNNV
jgi:hypothetical protein